MPCFRFLFHTHPSIPPTGLRGRGKATLALMAGSMTENDWHRVEELARGYQPISAIASAANQRPAAAAAAAGGPARRRAASPRNPDAQRWGLVSAPPRVVPVREREAGMKMFDGEQRGMIWAFDLRVAMEAAGYSITDEQAEVVLKAFGVSSGAAVSITQFHAFCDYYEGLAQHNRYSPVRGDRAAPVNPSKRPGLPNYKEFPGYVEGKRYSGAPSVAPSSVVDEGTYFAPADLPRPPQHLYGGNDGGLSIRQSAFCMFDIDQSGFISTVNLPSAFRAAGIKKPIEFTPHIANLLRFIGVVDVSPTVSQATFHEMCSILQERGVKFFAKTRG